MSSTNRLTEEFVQDAFHSYLKSRFVNKFVSPLSLVNFSLVISLTQAKAEKLLDADVLASAAGDLMITGAYPPHWSINVMLTVR